MRLLATEYCPITGITEEAFFDDVEDKLVIRRSQDVEHTLAMNKVMFNQHTGKKPNYNDSEGVHHVAQIPLMVLEKWQRETGFNWLRSTEKERKAILNNSDNSKFLVRPGKL